MVSLQARALRYAFLAEREAAHISVDTPAASLKPRQDHHSSSAQISRCPPALSTDGPYPGRSADATRSSGRSASSTVSRIGVVGSGVMGTGIAASLLLGRSVVSCIVLHLIVSSCIVLNRIVLYCLVQCLLAVLPSLYSVYDPPTTIYHPLHRVLIVALKYHCSSLLLSSPFSF